MFGVGRARVHDAPEPAPRRYYLPPLWPDEPEEPLAELAEELLMEQLLSVVL